MNQEQNQVKKTNPTVRRVTIKTNQVLQVLHPLTNSVLNIAIDLDSEFICIDFASFSSGELGLAWDGKASKFVQSLLASNEVQS
ncbi:MAG: hypothetical protein ACXVDR_16770 [Bacteroidia bacterium]